MDGKKEPAQGSASGFWWYSPTAADNYATLPPDWFAATADKARGLAYFRTREEAIAAAREAYAKLPPERQAELGPVDDLLPRG